MVFSLGEFSANTYNFINHGLAQTSNIDTLIACTPPPPTHTSYQIFKKGGGLDRTSTFKGGLLEKRGLTFFGGGRGGGGGLKFLQKNFYVIAKN